MADVFGPPSPDWDLVADVEMLLEYPYMRHAFAAAVLVALLCGVVGWLMVLRDQTYAGHTLAMVSFPGAAGAALLGISPMIGYVVFCVAGGAAINVLAPDRSRVGGARSGGIATVQVCALALGLLFASHYHGLLGGLTSFLFGTFTGVTSSQVLALAAITAVVLAVLAMVARPLLFASLDPAAAGAVGVPVRLLGLVFLLLLGAAVSQAAQLTGSLLVLAVLVGPASAARELTARPLRAVVCSVLLGTVILWTSLAIAYFTTLPTGFVVTTLAFGAYVAARLVAWRSAGGQR